MTLIKTGCCVACLVALLTTQARAQTTTTEKVVSLREVKSVIDKYFEKKEHRKGDIITQTDVKAVFKGLEAIGWKVSNQKELLERTLSEQNYMVQQLKTRSGRRFMQKIARYPQVYSRLDRLSREPGGRALVRDLIRLPNGEKYAQPSPPRGVPEMSEFLPKRGNSRQPKVKDYRKPTGRIYRLNDLLKELDKSYKKDFDIPARKA